MTRIRTLDFLPSIFQTSVNSQFLGATLDQLVNPPVTKQIDGFVGSKLGFGINALDYYVTEPTKERIDYQLEPGVIFTKTNESVAKDFLSYPGILDGLKLQNGITNNNDKLFNSQFYSWDSFTNLDMIINYNQYYWLPEGPPAVTVSSGIVYNTNDYTVTDQPNAYELRAAGQNNSQTNPTITLMRGGTYLFNIDQDSEFWIQGTPGTSGYSPLQSNLYTRDILGVTNNGATTGIVTFNVPLQNAQEMYDYPGDIPVDVVSTIPYATLDGATLNSIGGIDGVTSLNGRTVMFYDTGVAGSFNNYFYTITYTGVLSDPTITLTSAGLIPTEQKIVPQYGTEYINIPFVRNITGDIERIPYMSAVLDTLYYQDGSNPNKAGIIKIVDSNSTNTIDVITEILGKKNYTSQNGVVFTNGLKIAFDGEVIPSGYLQGTYYVQGVGTGIELINTETLIVPEDYTDSTSVPYDMTPYDVGNFDANLFVPVTPDYITIARNSINKNAWSRGNRWFHIQVIQDTANYLNDPTILTTFGNDTNNAKRPIIEFYPNLKLFNSGTIGKNAIDFIDTRTIDTFNDIAGQSTYYPDVETYTTYTGSIQTNPSVQTGNFLLGQTYSITDLSTTTVSTWENLGATLLFDGQFSPGTQYIITNLGTTDWNSIAGTTGVIYTVGSKFTAVNQGVIVGIGSGTALTVLFTATGTGEFNSADFEPSTEYFISNLGLTNWGNIGASVVNVTTAGIGYTAATALAIGQVYVIMSLGTTDWNIVAGTTGITYSVGSRIKCASVGTGTGQAGTEYYIKTLGTVSQQRWNTLVGTTNVTYNVGDKIIPISPLLTGDGVLIKRQFTTNSSSLEYTNVGTGTAYQGFGTALSQTVTTVTIDSDEVTGSLVSGMYINDLIINQQSKLPPNTRIYSIEGTTSLTITVFWDNPSIIPAVNNIASFVANTKNNADLQLYSGARIVFANDENLSIRNKIYVVDFNTLGGSYPVITLTESFDGLVLPNEQFVVIRGQINQGNTFYFDGLNYILAQQKPDVNIQPKFDIFDQNGISFGNSNIYQSTNFEGCDLFRYKTGLGANDSILGFPITYNSINNVSDITFEVALNVDAFSYVNPINNVPSTEKINTGFVHNFNDRTTFELLTGWQTAVAPSVQYQVFEFTYTPNNPPLMLNSGDTLTYIVTCDIPTLSRTNTVWPNIQVYNNNVLLAENTDYVVTYKTDSTDIDVFLTKDATTVIQVLLLSDQVSENAYFTIPINLSNNPFNTNIETADIGDIRGHYQSIYYNNPDTQGVVFGSNNTRDLGNIVPWGNKIIQNSASLVLPSAFLRTSNHNLFNSLEFNSREYIKFKSLLVDTVNKTDYQQRFDPSFILDDALSQIASVKNQDMSFFWSDMLPSQAPYITNVYDIYNTIPNTTFPLSQIYNYKTANYNGVLVYLQTTVDNINVVKQLYRNIEYTVSETAPSVIVNKTLVKGDKIIVKEYNQTYGSYVPNTPTKLGLYPATIPSVILDTSYIEPTYFIRGHDGSYTKLYGTYYPDTGLLVDYRDQALLEFETRVYNNLKLSTSPPINIADIVPGYFRETDYSYNEFLQIYTPQFLNWVGQNRVDYKTQVYLASNQFTYNYKNSLDRLDKSIVQQGCFRGFYQYYYDTSVPNLSPWEMLGYTNMPDWWTSEYGPAPYTSNNLVLWQDLENGIDYNNGDVVVREQYKRPGLTQIIPVDSSGNLLQPFNTIIGNYNNNTLRKNWVIGDVGPVEFSYRRSSTYPFDLMRLYALMKPAEFFNLCVDLDNYKYNSTLDQYLYNNRSHLVPSEVEIYGNGTAKTSYINWIVDYEKQLGVGATEKITDLLGNLDVRLVYRLAGFSDKTLLKFFVEKGSPDSRNASLLIPDESFQVLLYENQPVSRIIYSGVVIQTDPNGYRVYGNSQTTAYFNILKPILNGNTSTVKVKKQTVEVAKDYYATVEFVPYGTLFYSTQELSQFLMSYGKYLETEGVKFEEIEEGLEVNWQQMVAEFLYWVQLKWQNGSLITLNPSANTILIDKESRIVQPLTLQQTNFILNQNLYIIDNKDLCIFRDGSMFKAHTLNEGDAISYAQFNVSNIEHGIVFDNRTLFDDVIYNLITGLKQNRIYSRGTKSAEWNGTMFASGFIYNQDNIEEYSGDVKYTRGSIVKYKNKYWTALKIVQPGTVFKELDWKETEYDEIQKGLLANPSTRSFESALYYNVDKANLEKDADLLSFSLIGFRPRPYMASADLTDITQVNVYKNLIKEKGTRNTLNAFKNAQLVQGGIDYEIHENWAILSGQFGGLNNNNFIDFRLDESKLTGNPGIVGLTNGNDIPDTEQLVPLYSLFNYGKKISDPDILNTIPSYTPNQLYPDAGYVNLDDVKMSAYGFGDLPNAVNKNGLLVPINNLYVNNYVWLANYRSTWQILTPYSIGQVVQVRSNLNGTSTVIFDRPHNLPAFSIFSIVNFDVAVNGYYIVNQVINPYQVLIDLNLGTNNRQLTGQGIGLQFDDARVGKPGDIQNLPLLNSEFTNNLVWVDENTDASWAVYRKSINYLYDIEFTRANSDEFGSSVNYNVYSDLLIGDAPAGKVYRYQYDQLYQNYQEDQILIEGVSFGTAITNSNNLVFISKPNGPALANRYVKPYVVNITTVSDDLIPYQDNDIPAVSGSTNFGQALAVSKDSNYLFVSDFDENVPTARNKVHVYRKNNISTTAPFIVNQTYQITELGTTDFTEIGAVDNKIGIYFIATGTGSGTGVATQSDYELATTINGPNTTADKFGYSLSTNYYGDTLVVGAPLEDFGLVNHGKSYVYHRLVQNFEVQNTSGGQSFNLVFTPGVSEKVSVYRNGNYLQASNYTITGSTLQISITLNAGDIVEVDSNTFVLAQELTTGVAPRVGVQFGTSVDNNVYGTEICVGAPYQVSDNNVEGAVYRYTYGSARFGNITSTSDVNVTSSRTLLLNGYAVTIPAGNAEDAANAINSANITNIQASAQDDRLTISLIKENIAVVNQELLVTSTETLTFAELGLELYTRTQTILCPHTTGSTQFGTTVKYNEHNSIVVSAPVGTRYALTRFDFTDDLNLDNDTVFDNNATQFLDSFVNAGAVYMFDYLENYNENLNNIGAYTYSQSCNAQNLIYGQQPYYGTALCFSDNKVVIGTPNFMPQDFDGQVIVYTNQTGIQNWYTYRESTPVVDINAIQNIQIYSAETNETLINLDYMDPLQGKLLGAIRENLDVVSNIDPAAYNNQANTQTGFVWGAAQVGTLWYDTSNVRYINYHQNDNSYNARYWGAIFPGSDPAIYSWIASNVEPLNYQGPGVVKDPTLFTVQTALNSSNQITPVYYFWVRDTNIVFPNKTLADSNLEDYINNPKGTGISYFAPILPDAYALYNCQTYINANDSVLHIGYSNTAKDDISHQEYTLIRENFASDFLPGFPNISKGIVYPEGLYDRMLDSLSGTDTDGAVVPDPFLPKAVQTGVLSRPKQSFFYNRYLALNNYLQYANSVLLLYPITELRRPTYLSKTGTYYDVTNFWTYVNYWVPGYDNNTKSTVQVPFYADLSALNVPKDTIVTVNQNNQGFTETYIYDGNGIWTRIGLQNGTIQFNAELYDYALGKFGFGGDFYSTTPYDQFPNEETRWIIRSINEQIFTNDLLIYRNKGLILLFNYIQSETHENQNYLPWLNKTSLIDVNHTIRELLPLQNFVSDNQEFLSGYVDEAKPYHVVIKEFLFDYKGTEVYQGDITDFDLPATFDDTIDKFVSPQLVYRNPNTAYEFDTDSIVWENEKYAQWFNNYGVSLNGQENYQITKLASYMTLASDFMIVENAAGFPVNGTVKLVDMANPNRYELIIYNSVDLALNMLSGLVRGANETEALDHMPGENVYIDLPKVLVLNSGKGYVNTPRVLAVIDTTIYPQPREEMILEAVMAVDKVIAINVINNGSGYAVTPKIVIDPSHTYTFTNVNIINNTIQIYAPELDTGDLVHYIAGTTVIAGLQDDQYYYVNVLDTVPSSIVAFYASYKDAINDTNRVDLKSTGSGVHILELQARAIPITTSSPVRENNITIKFDRTSFNSQVTDWTGGNFYAAPLAGYYNSTHLSSSGVELSSVFPDISSILASNDGVVFPITNVTNDVTSNTAVVTAIYPGIREATATNITNNTITVPLNSFGTGGTSGLYTGITVLFTGNTFGGVEENVVYYVVSVLNNTAFTISDNNESTTIKAVSINNFNQLIVENTVGLSVNDKVIFGAMSINGSSVSNFGNIVQGSVYYIKDIGVNVITLSTTPGGSVVSLSTITQNNQTFAYFTNQNNTLALTSASGSMTMNIELPVSPGQVNGQKFTFYPTSITYPNITGTVFGNLVEQTIEQTISATNYIAIDGSIDRLYDDLPFTVSANVGGLYNDRTYYMYDIETITIDCTNTTNSTCTIDADFLGTTMTVNTKTGSGQLYPGSVITGTGLLEPIYVISYMSGSGGIGTYTVSGSFETTVTLAGLSAVAGVITTQTGVDTTGIYGGMPIVFTGNNLGGVLINAPYYVRHVANGTTFVISVIKNGPAVSLSTNIGLMTGTGSISLYAYLTAGSFKIGDMYDIKTIGTTAFNSIGATLAVNNAGGFVIGEIYIIQSLGTTTLLEWNIIAGTLNQTYTVGSIFTAQLTGFGSGNGAAYEVRFTATGAGTGTGTATVIVSNSSTTATLTQEITTNPIFDINYLLGGYNATIVNGGTGFAVDNTIIISGALVGGATPENDVTVTVVEVDNTGAITNTVCTGTPVLPYTDYYLQVIDSDSFKVYSDPEMLQPVSGIGFPYSAGSYMLLPTPIYFDQSIVKYNNRVYACVVSNNDDDFVFGKWEELSSGDNRLNAMDRVYGYYTPNVNMPGVDLQQLFTGVTYPNTTYRGNSFDSLFTIDTRLSDTAFTNATEPMYTVQGDSFVSGYAPEELVPGLITDQLTMIVTTRAGTNWPVELYGHTGYNVASTEHSADISNIYSFRDIVEVPVQIGVFVITNGVSTTLYSTDYTVNWVDKSVTLDTNIVAPDQLRIDVYEVGNGDQLVKSDSDNNPITTNSDTGFDEIYLNCNYSGSRITGGGIVYPDTGTVDDTATQTDGTNDVITVNDISEYTLNTGITFAGTVFGGVVENTTYYVKTINLVQSKISISDTLVSNIAGPVFNLSTASGSMNVVLTTGPGTFYTEPLVYSNGTKLRSGHTNNVVRTKSSTSSIVTYTTAGLSINDTIIFGDGIMGTLVSNQTYYIKNILNSTEFTVSLTLGGSTVSVTDAVGSAIFVSNDYAAQVADDGITAKIILAAYYDHSADYISYSFFAETEPVQYGYTIPTTQIITSDGGTTYDLTNYLTDSNADNAIVEVDGLRVMPATSIPYDSTPYDMDAFDYDNTYTISPLTDTILFEHSIPTAGQTIAITTFNDTQRQYLTTQFGESTVSVNSISNIVMFGLTTRITTTVDHNLVDNDVVRLDDIVGIPMLNNNTYYVNVINSTTFDIYQIVYNSTPGATNYNVVITSSYISGGYAWKAYSYILTTTHVVGCDTEHLNVASVDNLVLGTPVYFTETNVNVGTATIIPELIAGNVYYINEINLADNTIKVGTSRSSDLTLTDIGECFINLTQWEQTDVDRLWVTVNGYRVASSNLRLNVANELSILVPIDLGDEIIITNMIPSSTPNELVYIQTVDQHGVGSAYRANSDTTTWLTDNVQTLDTVITVHDFTKLVTEHTQSDITPALINGIYTIPLNADKNEIIQVSVYNNNVSRLGFISQQYVSVNANGTGPYCNIVPGSYIQAGDLLTIVVYMGKRIYCYGEYMTITGIDITTNELTVLRGVNDSILNNYIPEYTKVYSLSDTNKMPNNDYDAVWNNDPGVYGSSSGDPLQISDTAAANFLNEGN